MHNAGGVCESGAGTGENSIMCGMEEGRGKQSVMSTSDLVGVTAMYETSVTSRWWIRHDAEVVSGGPWWTTVKQVTRLNWTDMTLIYFAQTLTFAA